MSYSLIHVDQVEPAGPGGAVRFVRRVLGVEAFGINWFEIPPNTEGREHDERETDQEEVNVIVRGSGRYRIDGREVDVEVGTFLRFDPGTTRVPIAGPEGMTMIAVGARRGSYEPPGSVLSMVLRLFIWNVAESRTSLDELRDSLPDLAPPSYWILNEVTERFGVVAFGEDLPEAIGWAQDLVGSEPDVYEEFDAL